jgi:TetR/AcrR family transcriptional regulator, transcriptional repressor for nem operon
MARTLEFDYTNALEGAMRLFWKTGYASTSLRDLLKGMGIGEGSFYNTLKSKKHAYLECLKHYNATVSVKRGQAFFAAPTAALGVRALFDTVLDCLDDPRSPSKVCLMAGSLTHEVMKEADLRAYVEGQLSTLAERMTERFAADRDAGLLPTQFDPQLVVPVIVTYLQGVWRMALISYDRTRFEKQIDLFLAGLGL